MPPHNPSSPSTTPAVLTSNPQVAPTAPGLPSNLTTFQDPTSNSHAGGSKKMLIIMAAILIPLVIAGAIGAIFVPKYLTTQYIGKIKPNVASLKTSTSEVNQIIGQMYATINNTQNPTAPGNIKVSGLLIHPDIASLIGSKNVLGISAVEPGLVELAALSMSQKTKGSLEVLTESTKKVQAASTAPADQIDSQLRQVKSETQSANDKVSTAQTELTSTLTALHDQPFMLTSEAQQKVAKNTTLDSEVKPFIDQSSKISKYYETISTDILSMDTAITSFKTALTSAGTSFAQLNNPNASPATFSSSLAQSQIYLNQAKKNADDIRALYQTLTDLPADQIPDGATKYHDHNVKVLGTVSKYFDIESKTFQTFIDSSKSLVDKINSGKVTLSDVSSYKTIIASGTKDANLADTQFASDLQALVGEEKSLTLDFWQNSDIFNKSKKTQDDLNSLENNLNSIK